MQKPTVGRIVLYKPVGCEASWPALITEVHNDVLVNVAGFEDKGRPFATHNVALIDMDGERTASPAHEPFCYWPPREQTAAQSNKTADQKR